MDVNDGLINLSVQNYWDNYIDYDINDLRLRIPNVENEYE